LVFLNEIENHGYILELDFVLFFENCNYEFKNHLIITLIVFNGYKEKVQEGKIQVGHVPFFRVILVDMFTKPLNHF